MNLETIHSRNAKVEADKAWETSWTRRILITVMTYVVVCFYLICLRKEQFYLHAFVPAGGYFYFDADAAVF